MRTCHLARQVAARHEVTVVAYATEEDAPRVRSLSETMTVRAVHRREPSRTEKRLAQLRSLASAEPFACRALHSPEMQRAIDELCATVPFDVVHMESSTIWSFALPPGVPVLLDEHNIEYELLGRLGRGERSVVRRSFNQLEYRRFRRFEQRCWTRAAGVVVTSEREEPTVRGVVPSVPVSVVPNAVDLDEFAPADDAVVPNTVVFNATFNYRPNFDAALHLIDEVWPLVVAQCPTARLTLVGNTPEHEARELARPGVELAGKVPDIRPYLSQAAVLAVPVRMGGGTRLKVVEGLSMGKPMVTTTLGCEGLAVRDREHLIIADDPQAFAAAILELFENPALGDGLGRAGRALAERHYSWKLAGDRLDALYRQITTPAATPGAHLGSEQVPTAQPPA
jgi:glycosyltransferase involved in cell wall biosynthesis